MTHVYNIAGTSSRKCKCSVGPKTWLAHWERGTGETLPTTCVAFGCRRAVEVGAHVQDGDDLRIVWIVPFCQYHNKRPITERIDLKVGITMCGGSMTSDCE